MAVAAAEPQYGYWPHSSIDATHMKTPSGDTVSVEAAKAEHDQLKDSEYAKKGYVAPDIRQIYSSANGLTKTGIICQLTPALPVLTRLSSIFHRK